MRRSHLSFIDFLGGLRLKPLHIAVEYKEEDHNEEVTNDDCKAHITLCKGRPSNFNGLFYASCLEEVNKITSMVTIGAIPINHDVV